MFSASEAGSTFECSLDNDEYVACTSPWTYAALPEGPRSFQVRATDVAGNTDPTPAARDWTIVPREPPPDPEDEAPPVPASDATTIGESTEFLYTGADPIQTGVAPGTISPLRVAVLRGRVLAGDGTPLPSVRISVLDHPELGQTTSREDGRFDLAVNGGGTLTLVYERGGFMPLQRHEAVPWQEFLDVDDVVLKPYDTRSTEIELDSGAPQVAEATPVVDADGSRRAVLMFDPGTDAVMELPDGSTRSLGSAIDVRATEYTVGNQGSEAMPSELPASSAYTYAVEFSVDEAAVAGATDVRFDKPVATYVDNFLGFPAGTPVPAAFYDRERAAWVPARDGIVIKIVAESGGVAMIDADDDGNDDPDTDGALLALGIDLAERQQLASTYDPGASLWRVAVRHFTPWDYNWPYGCPGDCPPPDEPPPPEPPCPDCEGGGSTIGFLNQTLGEELPLTGTPFALHYSSDRLPGYSAADAVEIPLSGGSVASGLLGINLQVDIAGRQYSQSFSPGSNLSHEFVWDGKDAYGRSVQGAQVASVRVGYVYQAVYLSPEAFSASFAQFGGRPLTGDRARQELTVWQEWQRPLGAFGIGSEALGGWTFDAHHAYDPQGKVLYLGDGSRRTTEAMKSEIRTVAGISFLLGGGTPATETALGFVRGVDTGPDGSFYIADTETGIVRRVTGGGEIETVAGGGDPADGLGDGLPATQAALVSPSDVAVGPDGAFFIVDTGNGRIRRVDPSGVITTVAGGGDPDSGLGDDGPATAASLRTPRGIALADDGTIYVADSGNDRVRRVTPDGRITTAAGGGSGGLGDGGRAVEATLDLPLDVAINSAGDFYIADALHHRIRLVRSDGSIETAAGNGGPGYSGDGERATEAEIGMPQGIDVSRDGTLYLTDRLHHVVRRVTTNGFIGTAAGTGRAGSDGDGGPPLQAQLSFPQDVAVAPDGSLYVADAGNSIVRRASTSLPGFTDADLTLPSEDGTELYLFTESGRHLRTLDALTGAPLYEFDYDSRNQLISITDGDGQATTIERAADETRTAQAIVAPGGQRTELTVGGAGYLTTIENPAGEQTQLVYTGGGLLTQLTEPGGALHTYSYDGLGRLIRDEDPDGSVQTLARAETRTSSTVTVRSRLGREAVYRSEVLSTGERRRTVRRPSGATTTSVTDPGDGRLSVTHADGSRNVTTLGPDPRFGMRAPIVVSELIETPGGVRHQMSATREVVLREPDDLLSVDSIFDVASYEGDSFTTTTEAPGTQPGDPSDWTITTRSAEGRQAVTILDERGRVVREKYGAPASPAAETVFTYDARGRVARIERGAESSTYAWDSLNRLTAETDALGHRIEYTYDQGDRVTAKRLAGGQIYRYEYDAAGNLISLTMPSGAVHAFGATPGRRPDRYEPPSSASAYDWSYTDDGLTQAFQAPSGRVESYAYDATGRLTSIAAPDATDSFVYPAAGATDRMARMTRAAAGGATEELTVSFDGFLPATTGFSGVAEGTFSYGPYNNALLPTRILLESGGDAVETQLAYDRDDLLTRNGTFTLTRGGPNGALSRIADLAPGLAVELEYDSQARLTRRTHTIKGAQVYSLGLAYDAAGRISERVETVDGTPATTAYSYDANDRLIGVSGAAAETHTYDANGNRLTGGAAYDSQDRLTMLNGVPQLYDLDGFLVGRGTDTFQYGVDGALLSATVGGQTVTYAYDALGRRVARTTPAGTHQYLYGGLGHEYQVAAVRAPSGQLTTLYYDDADALFALERGGNRFYVATDQVGSPRIVTDANGTIVRQIAYDSFGAVLDDTAPGFDLPIGFAGGLADPLTGLVRFGRRDYDPAAGRWTAKDPIFFAGSPTNLYVYVDGDPVGLRDPSGLGDLPFFPQGPRKIPYVPDKPTKGKPRSEYQATEEIAQEGKKGVEEYKNPLKRAWDWCTDALAGGDKPPPPPPPPPKPPPQRELPQFQPGRK